MMTYTKKIALGLLVGATFMTLGACGATTGGVAKTVAAPAVVEKTTVTKTTVVAPATVKVGKVNSDTSCEQLTVKMAQIDAEMADNQAIIEKVEGGQFATGAAEAGVAQGVAMSGVASKVPFGGMFANSLIGAKGKSDRKKAAKAKKALVKSTYERAKVEGLYAGKGCS